MSGAARRLLARGPRSQRGFTLIELLVGLAVLGLAAGMLLASVGTAATVAVRGRTHDAALDEVIAAQAIVRARIEALRPVLRGDSTATLVDAQGDADGFAFIAPPLGRDQPDALRRYRLALDAAGNLTLYSASVLDQRVDAGDRAMVGWTPVELLRGVHGLALRYYGLDAAGRRGWQAGWDERPQPPDLVAVRVDFSPGDRRVWPTLLIAPRATANAACRIDALTGRCKEQA